MENQKVAQLSKAHHPKFISLRLRLLIGFTLIFSGVFSAAFYWFYTFASQQAVNRLRADLEAALLGAAKEIDPEEVLELYAKGEPNSKGFSDDPLYQKQLEWFEQVHSLEPQVWPYTFVRGNQPDTRRNGAPIQTDNEVIFLVDLWANYDSSKSVKFLEPYGASPEMIESLETGVVIHRPEVPLYDKWGGWITAYAPLRDDEGNIVPNVGIGADITAEHLFAVQKSIRNQVIPAFLVTYSALFALVYIISGVLTRPTIALSKAAQRIGEGDYNQDLSFLSHNRRTEDEMSQLARVFEIMLEKVRRREENLKQQVEELKIEIDHAKRHKQVSEIANTDFFQDLMGKAREIRRRKETL